MKGKKIGKIRTRSPLSCSLHRISAERHSRSLSWFRRLFWVFLGFGVTTRQNFGAAAGVPKAEKLRVDPTPRKALLGQLTFIFLCC